MKNYRSSETVNTGSMADIAFLLLIFFLVTTTITSETGINRELPAKCPDNIDCTIELNERNVLRIIINNKQKILVENEVTNIDALKLIIKNHIDNNADGSCNYCKGNKDLESSTNPIKAVISLEHDRNTNYNTFISVQDEISKAYTSLREKFAQQKFNNTLENLTASEMKKVKQAYPIQIYESVTN